MEHRDVHAARCETGRRLKAEQAAADDDRLVARLRGNQHGVDVVKIAIGQHAGQVMTRDRA